MARTKAEAAEYRLSESLAGRERPHLSGLRVTKADDLLALLVAAADNQGRYYASSTLVRWLAYWDTRLTVPATGRWLAELVERADIVIAPLARCCYSGQLFDVLTIQDRRRFSRWVERQPIPLDVRLSIYERDEFSCLHCGAAGNLSLDHIWPVSRGGSDDPGNLQTLCRPCNSRKGARV